MTRHHSSTSFALSRRQLLAGIGAGSFALAVGTGGRLALAQELADKAADAASLFEPNAFIRIDTDGQVTVVSSYLEMGQGTFTGLATLAADELDADPAQVRVEAAPADASRYTNPFLASIGFAVQGTGGSSAMAGAWNQMRQAAAGARAMLLSAAARDWDVDAAELSVEAGRIRHAASGREDGFGAFVATATTLTVPRQVTVKDPSEFRLIGGHFPRVDVPAKVNGSAIYTQDIKLDNMLVAVIAHPPRLWSTVRSVDAAAALEIPGVQYVVEVPAGAAYQGGVAVLARNTWVAAQGRDALDIDWDESLGLTTSTAQIFERYRALAEQPGNVSVEKGTILDKVPEGGHVIEATFEQPFLAHAAMEPMNCVVHIREDGVEVWNGEQWHTADQGAIAAAMGIEPGQVTINQLYAGGSFGRRANPFSDYVLEALAIARAAREQGHTGPVKMVWLREDDTQALQYRPATVHKVRLVLRPDGEIGSLQWRAVGQSFFPVPEGGTDALLVEGASDFAYRTGALLVDQHLANDQRLPVQWMRSVGHTHTNVVGETIIDEAARLVGRDAYEYRYDLLSDHPRQQATLKLAADKAGWGTPLAPGADGDRRARGIAVRESFGTVVAQVAELTLHADGSYTVDRVVCAVDCGYAINPDIVKAQMEGGIGFGLSFLRQEITLEDGQIQQSNFHDYPVLRMNAMPVTEVHIVPSGEAPTGVGEPGVPPIAPAVLNALAALTGSYARTLPLGDSVSLT